MIRIKLHKDYRNRMKKLYEFILDFTTELAILNDIADKKEKIIGKTVIRKKLNLNLNEPFSQIEEDENKLFCLKKKILDLKVINNKLFENYVSIKALKDKNIIILLRELTFLMNLTKIRIVEYNDSNNSELTCQYRKCYIYDKSKTLILPINFTFLGKLALHSIKVTENSIYFWKSLATLFELKLKD
jgi:hypothetical protein